MKTIYDLCRRLNNPVRREFLRRIYTTPDVGGYNVGLAQYNSGVGMSGTSQYLKQLEELGLVRRERSGKYVNYHADWSQAPSAIKELAALFHERFSQQETLESLADVFHVVMNPIRGRVLNWLSKGGSGEKACLCKQFLKRREILARDLKPAVDLGLLEITDDDDAVGEYRYLLPTDPIAQRIIALAI